MIVIEDQTLSFLIWVEREEVLDLLILQFRHRLVVGVNGAFGLGRLLHSVHQHLKLFVLQALPLGNEIQRKPVFEVNQLLLHLLDECGLLELLLLLGIDSIDDDGHVGNLLLLFEVAMIFECLHLYFDADVLSDFRVFEFWIHLENSVFGGDVSEGLGQRFELLGVLNGVSLSSMVGDRLLELGVFSEVLQLLRVSQGVDELLLFFIYHKILPFSSREVLAYFFKHYLSQINH